MDPDFPNEQSAWALIVQNSQNIIVFGAGLYSFFRNFSQTCLSSNTCQNQILSIDNTSTVSVYSLSTLGATMQLSLLDTGIIPESQNRNGLAVSESPWIQDQRQLIVPCAVHGHCLDSLARHQVSSSIYRTCKAHIRLEEPARWKHDAGHRQHVALDVPLVLSKLPNCIDAFRPSAIRPGWKRSQDPQTVHSHFHIISKADQQRHNLQNMSTRAIRGTGGTYTM